MRFTPCCDWDADSGMYGHRATTRDDKAVIGPEDNVDLTLGLGMSSSREPTPEHNREKKPSPVNKADLEEEMSLDIVVNNGNRATSLPPSLNTIREKGNKILELFGKEGTDAASTAESQSDLRNCTEVPGNAKPETEHIEVQTTPTVTEAPINTQPGTELVEEQTTPAVTEAPIDAQLEAEHVGTRTTPTAEIEDDDEIVITEVRPKAEGKRKQSASPTQGPAKKRAKHNDTENPEGKEEEAPASITARAQTLESEDADESEEECESEDEEAEDPQAPEKLAAAKRVLAKACIKCKRDANKALKYTYEQEISRLKREHQRERRASRDKATRILKSIKSDATAEKKDLKERHEREIKDLKDTQNTKLSSMKKKHETAILDSQKKHNDDKEKIKDLTKERNDLQTKQKEIERNATKLADDAMADLVAGERRLKEEKRQMLREKMEEVDQLKPEHSKVVKQKDNIIKDMKEQIKALEDNLKHSNRDLRDSQTESAADKRRFSHCKSQLAETQRETSKTKVDLQESEKFALNVEKRASAEVARLKERLDIERNNVREQQSRVITFQRHNNVLNDSINTLKQLGRDKREECQKLRAELKATKAELGVAADFDVPEGFDEQSVHVPEGPDVPRDLEGAMNA